MIFIVSVSHGNGVQPSKKALTWEMKLSLYKKSLQNTISFSQSVSFSKTPGQSWRLLWSSGEFLLTPSPIPVIFMFSPVSLQCQGAALPQHPDLLYLCTKPRATILLGPDKDPCVFQSTWGSPASSRKPTALKTQNGLKLHHFVEVSDVFCHLLLFHKISLYNLHFSPVGHLVPSSGLTAPTSS